MKLFGRDVTWAALRRKVGVWLNDYSGQALPEELHWVRIPGLVDSLCLREDEDSALLLPLAFDIPEPSLRVAVVMHLFYVELAAEMRQYVEHLPWADLYISTTDVHKKAQLEQIFASYVHGHVEIRVFPNRGRDIAPTFVGFRDIYTRYDVCVHLHSKKSLHATDKLRGWREYSYRNLLDSEDTVRSILHILSVRDIGVVFPQCFPPVREAVNWGRNFEATSTLLSLCGIKLDNRMLVEFPAGSMFWFKPQALRQLWDNGLTFDDFPAEQGQIDGTLAHGFERAVLYVAEHNGYRWAKTILAGFGNDSRAAVLASKDETELQANLVRAYRSVLQVHD